MIIKSWLGEFQTINIDGKNYKQVDIRAYDDYCMAHNGIILINVTNGHFCYGYDNENIIAIYDSYHYEFFILTE
jgi:hypothetical protein